MKWLRFAGAALALAALAGGGGSARAQDNPYANVTFGKKNQNWTLPAGTTVWPSDASAANAMTITKTGVGDFMFNYCKFGDSNLQGIENGSAKDGYCITPELPQGASTVTFVNEKSYNNDKGFQIYAQQKQSSVTVSGYTGDPGSDWIKVYEWLKTADNVFPTSCQLEVPSASASSLDLSQPCYLMIVGKGGGMQLTSMQIAAYVAPAPKWVITPPTGTNLQVKVGTPLDLTDLDCKSGKVDGCEGVQITYVTKGITTASTAVDIQYNSTDHKFVATADANLTAEETVTVTVKREKDTSGDHTDIEAAEPVTFDILVSLAGAKTTQTIAWKNSDKPIGAQVVMAGSGKEVEIEHMLKGDGTTDAWIDNFASRDLDISVVDAEGNDASSKLTATYGGQSTDKLTLTASTTDNAFANEEEVTVKLFAKEDDDNAKSSNNLDFKVKLYKSDYVAESTAKLTYSAMMKAGSDQTITVNLGNSTGATAGDPTAASTGNTATGTAFDGTTKTKLTAGATQGTFKFSVTIPANNTGYLPVKEKTLEGTVVVYTTATAEESSYFGKDDFSNAKWTGLSKSTTESTVEVTYTSPAKTVAFKVMNVGKDTGSDKANGDSKSIRLNGTTAYLIIPTDKGCAKFTAYSGRDDKTLDVYVTTDGTTWTKAISAYNATKSNIEVEIPSLTADGTTAIDQASITAIKLMSNDGDYNLDDLEVWGVAGSKPQWTITCQGTASVKNDPTKPLEIACTATAKKAGDTQDSKGTVTATVEAGKHFTAAWANDKLTITPSATVETGNVTLSCAATNDFRAATDVVVTVTVYDKLDYEVTATCGNIKFGVDATKNLGFKVEAGGAAIDDYGAVTMSSSDETLFTIAEVDDAANPGKKVWQVTPKKAGTGEISITIAGTAKYNALETANAVKVKVNILEKYTVEVPEGAYWVATFEEGPEVWGGDKNTAETKLNVPGQGEWTVQGGYCDGTATNIFNGSWYSFRGLKDGDGTGLTNATARYLRTPELKSGVSKISFQANRNKSIIVSVHVKGADASAPGEWKKVCDPNAAEVKTPWKAVFEAHSAWASNSAYSDGTLGKFDPTKLSDADRLDANGKPVVPVVTYDLTTMTATGGLLAGVDLKNIDQVEIKGTSGGEIQFDDLIVYKAPGADLYQQITWSPASLEGTLSADADVELPLEASCTTGAVINYTIDGTAPTGLSIEDGTGDNAGKKVLKYTAKTPVQGSITLTAPEGTKDSKTYKTSTEKVAFNIVKPKHVIEWASKPASIKATESLDLATAGPTCATLTGGKKLTFAITGNSAAQINNGKIVIDSDELEAGFTFTLSVTAPADGIYDAETKTFDILVTVESNALRAIEQKQAPARQGIYDLRGRKLLQAPSKGLYIENGKLKLSR